MTEPQPHVREDLVRAARMGRWILRGLVVVAILVMIGSWPVTTRVGVNYEWSSRRIPLYEKAMTFLSRDLQTRRLAKGITANASTDQEQLRKLFTWVTANVRQTPQGFPVIDDHPLHILIRGYGAPDQRTEVFTLLAGYSGFQASVAKLTPPAHPDMWLYVALVRVGPQTFVFDINNQVVFLDEHGHFVDVRELVTHPQLMETAANGRLVRGIPYEQYLMALPRARSFSRTHAQQLWPRVKQEVARILGMSSG